MRSAKELGDRAEGRTNPGQSEHGMAVPAATIPSKAEPVEKQKSAKAIVAQAEKNINEAGGIMGKLAPPKFALDHLLKQVGIDQMPSFTLVPAQESKKKIDAFKRMHNNV